MEDTPWPRPALGEWLLRRARSGHSAFALGVRPARTVYLLDPEHNALVFGNDDWFSVHEAYRALEVVDGPTSVVLSDGDEHRRRRGLVRPALAPRRIDGYLETMAASADEALDQWGEGTAFDASEQFRSAIRRSTLRALFGSGLAQRSDDLGALLQPQLDLVDHLPQVIDWHRRLRSPAWRRADRARAGLDAIIVSEIERQRATDGDDSILRMLVHGRDGSGSGLTTQEIRDQAVTLIAAGYETTGGAMAWVIHALGRDLDWQQRARDEVAQVLGERVPEPADLRRLPVLHAVVNESLRLHPPAIVLGRTALVQFSVPGLTVRPGDLVVTSPYVTHRRPDVFTDPTAFRPDRWLSGRAPGPDEFLPFGGGQHRCLGSTMAIAELVVMLARLLRRGPYRLAALPRRTQGFAALRPDPGITIVRA